MLIPTTLVLLVQILALPLRSSMTWGESLHFLAPQIPHWWNSDHIAYLSVSLWGLNKSLTQHVAHIAVVTHLFWKVLYSRCPLREPEMPNWGILNISALSWQSVWYRISWPSHLAYSSVLSHGMMGNRPEKPWGKSTAEVGFQFSFYRLYDNA